MAGVINLADKYSSQVLERFFQDSYTQGSFSKKFDGEFIGVKSVRFHEVCRSSTITAEVTVTDTAPRRI